MHLVVSWGCARAHEFVHAICAILVAVAPLGPSHLAAVKAFELSVTVARASAVVASFAAHRHQNGKEENRRCFHGLAYFFR
jgi:hypothetical protein